MGLTIAVWMLSSLDNLCFVDSLILAALHFSLHSTKTVPFALQPICDGPESVDRLGPRTCSPLKFTFILP